MNRFGGSSSRLGPRRLLAMVVVSAATLSACSVSTPRDGFSAQQAGQTGGPTGAGPRAAGASAPGVLTPLVPRSSPAVTRGEPGAAGAGSHASEVHGSGPRRAGGPAGSGRVTPSVGVTKSTITISFMGGFSGPYGQLLQEAYDEGFDTWLRDLRDRGGIFGRNVVVKLVDHKETADGGVAACKESGGNGSLVGIIAEGTGEANVAAANCLDKAAYPTLAQEPTASPAWRHTFLMLPTADDQARSLGGFVKNVMKDGDAKLGVIYLQSMTKSQQIYVREARALGMNVVATESVAPNQASYTSQLLRLRNAGASNVAILATVEAIGIWRDAASLNYTPHWTGFSWTFDVFTQGARQLAEGARGLALQATTESPAYRAWLAKAKKYGKKDTLASTAALLYGYGLLLEAGLRAAGPNPTRAGFEAGLRTLRNFDTGLMPPLTFTGDDIQGTRASFPVECCRSDYTLHSLGPARARF